MREEVDVDKKQKEKKAGDLMWSGVVCFAAVPKIRVELAGRCPWC